MGSARGGGLLSVPPADAWLVRGVRRTRSPPWRCLPPAWFGQEGGSWQLAPCLGIVLGLNGRHLGFSGDWKPFPSAVLARGGR